MNPYRVNVWQRLNDLLPELAIGSRVLDFGSGDGWFASQMIAKYPEIQLTAVDVKRRDSVLVEPLICDGVSSLPFSDSEFDLAYSVDVLHHCTDPFFYLDELARVATKYLLIKDHTYRTFGGKLSLAVLDELGNRKFGIPSLYKYQYRWDWRARLESRGWKEVRLLHPLQCHTGALGFTNKLQYAALYQKAPAS